MFCVLVLCRRERIGRWEEKGRNGREDSCREEKRRYLRVGRKKGGKLAQVETMKTVMNKRCWRKLSEQATKVV
ncbi:hypothetical protein E2C01_021938 [Portunus trituberculatus]|uniref:Uncharacterized protein n=1 Tax=Portunus trituberculatus TaxID=210409 RepID=A0A5B7E4Q7_PORTR|nr:hypothetical protein [Portunus trituberculatus]